MPDTSTIANGRNESAGIEEWLKRATICFALVYVNGYVAFHAFASTFGLTPKDFGMDEKDYLMQGIINLVFDSGCIVEPRFEHWSYYLTVVLTWILLAWGLYLAFAKIPWRSGRKVLRYSGLLALVFVLLSVVAAQQGTLRARVAKDSFEHLPYVQVAYESAEGEHRLNQIYGQLLVRTEKVICLVNVSRHVIDTNVFDLDFKDKKLHVLPTDRAVRVSVQLPPRVEGLLSKKDNSEEQ